MEYLYNNPNIQGENNMELLTNNPDVQSAMITMAGSLASLVLKGTATVVHTKIESIKNVKDANQVRSIYNEIINQLLEEREEAVRIAQAYKQELEKVVIDDKDIEYLHDTISKVLDIIKMFQMVGVDENTKEKIDTINAQMETIESLKALISKDVLKTMQLLGFNFKAAIGEPLTQICASAISSLGNKQSKNTGNNKRR